MWNDVWVWFVCLKRSRPAHIFFSQILRDSIFILGQEIPIESEIINYPRQYSEAFELKKEELSFKTNSIHRSRRAKQNWTYLFLSLIWFDSKTFRRDSKNPILNIVFFSTYILFSYIRLHIYSNVLRGSINTCCSHSHTYSVHTYSLFDIWNNNTQTKFFNAFLLVFFKYRWYAFFFYDNKLNENKKDSFVYVHVICTLLYIYRDDDDGKLLKKN